MSAVIGALRVNLGIDTAAFGAGLKQAGSRLGGFAAAMRKAVVPVAAGMTAAAAGIGVAVKNTIDAADEMHNAAQKIGIPTEELSRLKYAADLSGVSFETLQTNIAALAKKMEAGAGVFDKLGVSVRDADGDLRPTSEVLMDIADALAAMPDGTQKTALIGQLGKSFKEMIPLLNEGSAALAKMMAEADKFGQVFTAEMGEQADEFNDNMDRLKGGFGRLAAQITKELLPHLAAFSQWLVENGPAIADFAGFLFDGIALIAGGLQDLFLGLRDLVDWLKVRVPEAIDWVRTKFGEMESYLVGLRDRFLQIGSDLISGLWEGLKAGAAALMPGITSIANSITGAFDWAFDRHSPSQVFAEMGRDLMAGLGLGLGSLAGQVENQAPQFAQRLADTFAGVLTGAASFRDALSSLLADIGGRMLEAGIGTLGKGLGIPGFANGTRFAPGGLAMVGERGPELVNLPRGSRVIPNSALGGAGQHVHVTVGVSDKGELRAYVNRVAQGTAAATVRAYDARLADRVSGINRDPRFRG